MNQEKRTKLKITFIDEVEHICENKEVNGKKKLNQNLGVNMKIKYLGNF